AGEEADLSEASGAYETGYEGSESSDDGTPLGEEESQETDSAETMAGFDADELGLTAPVKSDEIRDLILAAEEAGSADWSREVTTAPSESDQNETERIVTEAVESGASPHEIDGDDMGDERNLPPSPPRNSNSAKRAEGHDAEMNQP